MEIFDDQMSIGKHGFNGTGERREGWLDGEVATPWGFVVCYSVPWRCEYSFAEQLEKKP